MRIDEKTWTEQYRVESERNDLVLFRGVVMVVIRCVLDRLRRLLKRLTKEATILNERVFRMKVKK